MADNNSDNGAQFVLVKLPSQAQHEPACDCMCCAQACCAIGTTALATVCCPQPIGVLTGVFFFLQAKKAHHKRQDVPEVIGVVRSEPYSISHRF